MRKTLIILAIFNIIAFTLPNKVDAQGFTIDTTVTTTSGFDIDNSVYSGFRIHSGYFGDTTLTFEFIFYADSMAMVNGKSPISVLDKTGVAFGYENKSYTPLDFAMLTFIEIMSDAKAILEEHFGNNIK